MTLGSWPVDTRESFLLHSRQEVGREPSLLGSLLASSGSGRRDLGCYWDPRLFVRGRLRQPRSSSTRRGLVEGQRRSAWGSTKITASTFQRYVCMLNSRYFRIVICSFLTLVPPTRPLRPCRQMAGWFFFSALLSSYNKVRKRCACNRAVHGLVSGLFVSLTERSFRLIFSPAVRLWRRAHGLSLSALVDEHSLFLSMDL